MSSSSVYLQSIQGLVKGEKNQISFTGTFFEVNECLEALDYAIDNGIENVTLSINVTDGKIVIHLVENLILVYIRQILKQTKKVTVLIL